jgi:hypothetical protein
MSIFRISAMIALAVAPACGSSPPAGSAAPLTTAPVSRPAPPPVSPPAASVTLRRSVISVGRASGHSEVTIAADGTITTALDIVENGRGPHVDATFRLLPDGTLASLTTSGHHTFGAAFHARYAREGDHAQWDGDEEAGARDLTGPAFYLPGEFIPELLGTLVTAAVRAGGTLPLVPGGTARVEPTGEFTVTALGQRRTLDGYLITGLDLSPIRTWMDRDGGWFGLVSDGFSVVPEGWEPAIEPLVAHQRALDQARDAQLAKDLAHTPPAAGLAFTHARVLDVERGRWLADHTVVVVADKITAVGPTASTRPPAGAEVIDLAGKAILPGLVDMHAHFGDADGLLDLAAGVTTARDVGNAPDQLDDYHDRFDRGAAIGPHLYRFGFIEGRNPKAASSKITAETPDEARAAVAFFAQRHYDGIKIYNSVRTELVPLLTAAAHQAGLAVTGHIPVHMLAHEAVRAGYDGIEHINMILLNFLATHDTDTRDTTRFTLIGERAADLDLASPPVVAFVKLLAQRKIVIDPTINVFEDLLVGEQGKITPGLEATVARLPAQTQRGYLQGGLPLDDARRARYRAGFDKLLAMTKALYDGHVPLVIGTDAIAGVMYHHELALFARAGIPNAAILRMATVDAARALRQAQRFGAIAPGLRADLVVVDGDPLARIGDAARTVTTMRAGVTYDTAALHAAVGVAPAR